jgi:hypothetical protein
MKTTLRVGDCVRWESQSSGYSTKKEGTVVAVVRGCGKDAITDRLDRFIPKELRETTKILFDGWQRPEDCYIIAVKSKSGRGKTRLYCPRVSALRGVRS